MKGPNPPSRRVEQSAARIVRALRTESPDWSAAMDAWLDLSLDATNTALEPTVRWLGEALRSQDREGTLAVAG